MVLIALLVALKVYFDKQKVEESVILTIFYIAVYFQAK